MAHFALLDDKNVVINVLYVENDVILDENGKESESKGIAQCREGLGDPNAKLVRTSYNHSTRGRYAGIGYTYDEKRDVFLTPKPYPSWVLDETNYVWGPPKPEPELTEEQLKVGSYYEWKEKTKSWDFVDMTPPEPPEEEESTSEEESTPE